MKKMIKVCAVMLVFALLFSSITFASETQDLKQENDSEELTEIGGKISRILNVISWIGYAVALGMILVLGMKYMMAAANERADLKKGSVNFVIGVIVITMASTIANIVSSIALESTGSQSGNEGAAQKIIDTGKNLGGLGGNSTK